MSNSSSKDVKHSVSIKARLSVLYFLQFAVWGCYLTCFGQLLGARGLGQYIAWFYAAVGVVSLWTPALMGHIADKTNNPRRLLALCHAGVACAMGTAFIYAMSHPRLEMVCFFPLYLLFLAFYMPTMALSNATTFSLLKSRGQEPVDSFPAIRVWGTVGFVAAMWFVNCAYLHDGSFGFTISDAAPAGQFRFQYTPMQLLATSLMGFAVAIYTCSLPASPKIHAANAGKLLHKGTLSIFFRKRNVAVFLIFAALGGMCLQISNGFATPYITHFSGIAEYAGTLAAGNATMLFSLSQISEAVCILAVGPAMRKLGIKWVFSVAFLAWCLRFLLLGLGNPAGGLWMLALSMVVYGVAFNFFTIAGHLYMEHTSTEHTKGLGQGVIMLMSNGIGATFGTIGAGAIVNHWCRWEVMPNGMRLFMGEWIWPWIIFALYAFIVGILFLLCFRRNAQ